MKNTIWRSIWKVIWKGFIVLAVLVLLILNAGPHPLFRFWDTAEEIRWDYNLKNITRLKKGMDSTEVRKIFGSPERRSIDPRDGVVIYHYGLPYGYESEAPEIQLRIGTDDGGKVMSVYPDWPLGYRH